MKESESTCACKHKVEKKYPGISITKVNKSCCNNETVVLSNTINLQTVKNEIPSNTLIILHYINNGILENISTNYSSVAIGLPDQIPKEDISIIISSLLI